MHLRKLTPKEFDAEARSAFQAVFLDPISKEPFSPQISSRLIIETPLGGFWLGEEQFDAVCFAAAQAGDQRMFCTWARGYLGGLELAPYYTWEIGLDWASYDAVDDQSDIDREHDIGIPLDRLFYSPGGKWGVQTPDVYAAVGGSIEFLRDFRLRYLDWENALSRFLESCANAEKRGVDMTWARILLHHVYGDNSPDF